MAAPDIKIGVTIELLPPGIENRLRAVADAIRDLSAGLHTMKSAGVDVSTAMQQVTRETGAVRGEITPMTQALTSFGEKLGFTREELYVVTDHFRKLGEQAKMTRSEQILFGKILKEQGIKRAEEYVRSLGPMKESLAESAYVSRRATADLGAMGVSLVRLSREVFWVGLGFMFITMSIARVSRMQYSLIRANMRYRRTLRRLNRAERERQEALRLFGPLSEQYIEASERLEEAQISVKEAEIAVMAASQQIQYAWGMLFFGMIPTIIRFLSSLFVAIKHVTIAEWLEAKATMGVAWAKHMLIFGLIGAVAAMGYFIYMMAEMERQMREAYDELTQLSHGLEDLPVKHGSPIEIKTKWGGWISLPEIAEVGGRLEEGLGIRQSITSYTVNIYNPAVQRREDILALRRELESLFIRGFSARGGR